MLERDIDILDYAACPGVRLSVRPSVCPSHAAIDSKLMSIRSRSFHRRVAKVL